MGRGFHRYSVIVVAAALLGVGGSATAFLPQASGASPDGQHQAGWRFTKALKGDLRGGGFRVSEGYPALNTIQTCRDYTYPQLKNCFAANAAAPYVIPVVKSWPNEYVDPGMATAFGPTLPGYTGGVYRLRPREAIVLYGKMPPPGRYMSLQTWEWSQQGRWKAKDRKKWANTSDRPIPMQYLFDTIPPKSGRVISFSALGDPVNNVVMKRRSGYSFEKHRYFIITPSATTKRAVGRALQARGVSRRHIFTEQIPSRDKYGPIGPLGMGKKAIDFASAFRYAVPDPGNEQAAAKWRFKLPLTVLRVRAPASVGPVKRYGSLTFGKRTAHSEAYLASDLQSLVDAVCGRTISTANLASTDCTKPPPESSSVPELFDGLGWTGPYCRAIGMDCLGDQQEAAYYFSKPLPLDSGQVYAVVGTLATQTGNATYVGLSVNDASILAGTANLLDTALEGSADGYAASVHKTGKFFVHYFARNCQPLDALPGGARNCTEITPEMVPLRGDTAAQGDPALRGKFMASLRDYIVPGTARGADSSKLLPPRILTFTKP